MQTEECQPEQAFEQKLTIRILSVVQYLISAEEAWQSSKICLDPSFQITQHVMFAVPLAVGLIVRIARVFAQNQLHRSVRRFVSSPLAHHSSRARRRRRFW